MEYHNHDPQHDNHRAEEEGTLIVLKRWQRELLAVLLGFVIALVVIWGFNNFILPV